MTSCFQNSWIRVPIGDVCLGIFDGPHATPKPASGGAVFLGIKNITEDGRLDLSEIRYIAEEDFPKWIKRVQPLPGDIVFTYEATLNRYAIIPKDFRGCLGRRLAVIKPNPEKIDNRFLFYYFFGEDWRRTIARNLLSGSTVDRIPISTFPTFEISLPPLSTQKRIADILSAYDRIIENNTRRIKILEEMARSLYDEWFVKFRFPGHEQTKLVDSELGLIPENWEVKIIRDVCEEISYGYTTSAKKENTGSKFLRITDIVPSTIDWDSVPYCEIPSDKFEKYKLEEGDIVIARTGATTGYAKRINKLHPKSIFASYLVRIRIDRNLANSHFIGIAVESDSYKRFIQVNLSGAAQPQANAQVLTSFSILIPTREILEKFKELVSPLFDQKEILQQKILNLRKTRDLLLPKLISGEIDVEKLEVTGEEGAIAC